MPSAAQVMPMGEVEQDEEPSSPTSPGGTKKRRESQTAAIDSIQDDLKEMVETQKEKKRRTSRGEWVTDANAIGVRFLSFGRPPPAAQLTHPKPTTLQVDDNTTRAYRDFLERSLHVSLVVSLSPIKQLISDFF